MDAPPHLLPRIGRGALVPDVAGPTHRYPGASAGGRASCGEVS